MYQAAGTKFQVNAPIFLFNLSSGLTIVLTCLPKDLFELLKSVMPLILSLKC